eukprot:1227708-Pleurochrysis_carterae.AAC.3
MTECNRTDLSVSTYRELRLRAPVYIQIGKTLGDVIRLPPGLRPPRPIYLPCLCIEAKVAQMHESSTEALMKHYSPHT